MMAATPWATWGIAALATAGVIVRPFSWPEFVWALGGAVLMVALGLLSIPDALAGVGKGTDVYLFLVGMVLLADQFSPNGGVCLELCRRAYRKHGPCPNLLPHMGAGDVEAIGREYHRRG